MRIFFSLIFIYFICFSYADCNINETYIVIHGETYTLELHDNENNLIKTYPVGLGKNGIGKTNEGDCKTPKGKYKILWKASVFWESDGGFPIIEGYSYCTKNNTFLFGSKTERSHSLCDDAYGGSNAVFMCLDYPNESDVEKGCTGSGIAIHASLLGGIHQNSSKGCIRMFPDDARDLYNLVEMGTYVYIERD